MQNFTNSFASSGHADSSITYITEDSIQAINTKLQSMGQNPTTAVAPIIPCEFESAGENDCFLDTGARATLIDLAFVSEHPELFEYMFIQHIQDTTGAFIYASVYKMKKDLTIAGVNLGKDYVAAVDFRPMVRKIFGKNTAVVLGMNHIRHADWILRLDRDEMYVRK